LNIERAEAKLQLVKEEIEVYNANESAILRNADIDVKMLNVQKQLETNKYGIDQLSAKSKLLHGNISVLEAKKTDLHNKLKEAEELENIYEAYSYYMEAVGRDGIPYELISKAIPNIEAEINEILSQIVGFTVCLEVDGKNINGKLVYDFERIWPLENSSGMERFITSLAIRVALMNASNLPKSNFLIVDEGFGTLDVEHLHSMQTLFNILKSHFDFILIVSHLDTARDMVDNLIDIKKEDGYSQIRI
jgi:DNA repair exonuclease SbcCD ATPase subunit